MYNYDNPGGFNPNALTAEIWLFDLNDSGVRPCNLRRAAVKHIAEAFPKASDSYIESLVDYVYDLDKRHFRSWQ